jgi:hypothetical protein
MMEPWELHSLFSFKDGSINIKPSGQLFGTLKKEEKKSKSCKIGSSVDG